MPCKYYLWSVFHFLLLNTSGIFAQEYRPLSCVLLKTEEIMEEPAAFSNVMLIKNNNGITREFYLEITVPIGWKTLNSSDKIYKLEPDDSIYVPIRIIPNKMLMKGSTKYNINVFVVTTDGRAQAMCAFSAGKIKRTSWEISVLPRQRIYFLNNQNSVPLSLYLANKGDEAQELNLSWTYLGRGLNLRPDSAVNKSFLDIKLQDNKDTVINFSADISRPDLNYSKVDIENYRFDSDLEARKYRIYFKATEPFYRRAKGEKDKTPMGFEEGKENNYRPASGGGTKNAVADLIKLNSSVDFIKLSNTAVMNNQGSGIIPITWYSNLFNVLGVQPMWSNNFISRFSPKENTFISANIQHFFTFYSPTRQTAQNLAGNIFYFSPKLDLNIGQGTGIIGQMNVPGLAMGGTMGSGLGIIYKPISLLKIASFYNQNPLFSLNPSQRSYGALISFQNLTKQLQITSGYTQTDFVIQRTRLQNIPLVLSWSIVKNQKIMGALIYTRQTDFLGTATQTSRQFFNWMANYSGSFFKNKLSQSFNANVFRRFLTQNNTFNTIFLNNRTGLTLNNYGFILNNGVIFNNSNINNNSIQLLQIPSNLSFFIKKRNKFQAFPSLFHTYTTDYTSRLHQAGMAINLPHFDYKRNLRVAINLRGSYNFFSDSITYAPLFNANVFTTFGYRTYSANIGYTYGYQDFQGIRQFIRTPNIYPQFIFMSFNKQHVFSKIKQFVFDFSLNYSWNNITYAHNLGLSPIIYFFTKKGWRFNASIFYNMNARNPELSRQFYTYQGNSIPLPEIEPGTQYASNFNLQFGLRKEFGVLLPKKWRKNFYANPNFVAFLDFNGNRIKDEDEVALENIVVQLNGHEAITDENGKCQFLNVEQKRYFYNLIPLSDLSGWFSLKSDSIDIGPQGIYYIPFTKGVKIEGSVLIDREKYTEDILADLDLSKIRIFTTDTSGTTYATLTDRFGNFNFYVPYGFYALSMDEAVLSDRFFIAQNNIPIELEDGLETYYQSFFIIEKRRRVKKKKFNDKGELITVEEVTNETKSTNNRKPTNKNEEIGIFDEERRNGSIKKDSIDVNRINYEELDKRIQRLDSIINELKEKSILSTGNSTPNQEFNRLLIMDALKQLKEEETRKTPYFIVQVASYTKGQQAPADLAERIYNGSVRILEDERGMQICYFGDKFTDASKATEALGYVNRNKIGKAEIKVLFQDKVLTLEEYRNLRR